jgi:hypothetical protein
MKSLFVFVLVGMLAIAQCFPGVPRDSDESSESDKANADTILILPDLQRNSFQPSFVIPDIEDDDDAFNPFRSNTYPLSGILKSMQNAMNKLRDQMSGVLSGFHGSGELTPWGKVPEGANTTSTTKVIDGHVVTINETTYKSDDDNTYVRVRILDVKPESTTGETPNSDSTDIDQTSAEVTDKTTNDKASPTPPPPPTTESTKEDTTPSRSVETVEDLGNNEIPDSQVDTLTA